MNNLSKKLNELIKIKDEFLRDITGDNISNKNPFYGEYTFHYWLWKNKLEKLDEEWIGFCQYRKFWGIQKNPSINDNLEECYKQIINYINKKKNNNKNLNYNKNIIKKHIIKLVR